MTPLAMNLGPTELLLTLLSVAAPVAAVLLVVALGRRGRSAAQPHLLRCTDCGGTVSPYASMCPHCGNPAERLHAAPASFVASPSSRVRCLGRVVLWISGLSYVAALALTTVAIAMGEIQPDTGPLFQVGIMGTALGFLLLYLAPQPGDGPGRWRAGRRCLKVALLFTMVGVWSMFGASALLPVTMGFAVVLASVGVLLVATAPTVAAAPSDA